MKKNIAIAAVYILAFVTVVVNLFYSIKGTVFSDINDLPKGEFINSVASPTGENVLNIYRVSNKIGTAVRGELKTPKKTSNIFWQTGLDNVDAVWMDSNVLSINGVTIDAVNGGFYDCRRGISLFQEGSIEGNEENIDE